MKNIILLFLLLYSILTSCNKKETPFIDLFQVNNNLEYKLIEDIPDVFLYHPIRKIIVNEFVIIADFKTKKIFHVINLKNKDYFQFGNKGRGPNEFTDGYGLTNLSDTSFVIFDRMKDKISFFSISKDSIEMYHEVKVPRVNNIIPYSENLFITNGNFPFKKNYGIIDLAQDTISSYINYPSLKNFHFEGNARKYYTHLVHKPSSSRFVGIKASHFIFDILEINSKKQLTMVNRKIYKDFEWEMNSNRPIPLTNNINIFKARLISASKNRIFTCFQNNSNNKKDWLLLTLDWDGNPIDKYTIPFIPYTITSVNDSTIYSIGLYDSDYKLYKINLKQHSR